MNQSKPVIQFDQDGRPVATFSSIREAARVTGVKRSTIYDSCSGRSKKGKGFHWASMAVDTGEEQRHRLIHASLFSGIGGPEVAAAMLGWENAFHCEINPFGKTVLDYWFPKSISYEDITKTDFHEWRGKIDVLTGGFPCQPFSYAGKRAGREDDRYLWPQMLRAIDEIRPTWVVGENVAGLATMVEGGICTQLGSSSTLFGEGDDLYQYGLEQTFTIERICRDLERLGYSVQPVLIPAAAVGAPHRRDRIFIIAHSADGRVQGLNNNPKQCPERAAGQPITDCEQGLLGNRQGWDAAAREQDDARTITADPADLGLGVASNKRAKEGVCEKVEGEGDNTECVLSIEADGLRGAPTHSTDLQCDGSCPGLQGKSGGKPQSEFGDGCRKDAPAADPDGRRGREVSPEVHPGFADGDKSLGDGGQRYAAHADGAGREESLVSGREADPAKDGARVDDRAERPCSDGSSSDTASKQGGRKFEQPEPRNTKQGKSGRRSFEDGSSCFADPGLTPENRWSVFPTVSPVHRGNDGLPFSLDDLTISPSKWRTESLKAYGNAIVPQVMYRIFQAIESTY